MAVHNLRCGSAVFLGALWTNAALADVTAQDVWSDWREYMQSSGYEITVTEDQSGNTLTLSDLSLMMSTSEPQASFDVRIDQIVLTENGDGTVSVAMSEDMPMVFTGVDESGSKIDVAMAYSQTGQTLKVSGTPEEMAYDFSATRAAFQLKNLTIDGEPSPAPVRLDLALNEMAGTSKMIKADQRSFTQTTTASSLTFDASFAETATGSKGAVSGTVNDVSYTGGGDFPLKMDPNNFNGMLKDGLNVVANVTFGAANSSVSGEESGDSFASTSSSSGGSLELAMNADQIAYGLIQRDMAISVTASELPIPLSLTAAEAGANLAMPVAKSDAPQDFSFGVTLKEFSVPEQLWMMLDPERALPRDPATLVLDITGKLKLLYDMLDPNVAAELEATGEAPIELESLSINQLDLLALGAGLNAKGGFTFDNTDLETFDGFPKPVGSLELSLAGGNALLDGLVEMGLLPQEQAMAARMMTGLFAVPGDAPDTLKSKIEVNEQGQVLANGQRLK